MVNDVAAPVRVRAAVAVDLPHLGKIWQELMDLHERNDIAFALAQDSLEQWLLMARDMLNRSDTFVLVGQSDNKPVGFCLGWIARNPPIYQVADVGFISEIAVTKTLRRKGVGTAMFQAARAWFRQAGIREFQLSTAVWNATAQKFWEQHGGQPLLLRYRFEISD